MKKCLLIAVVVVAGCWGAEVTRGAPTGSSKGVVLKPGKPPGDPMKAFHERVIKALKLDAKQDAPVRKLFADHRVEMAAWVQAKGPQIRQLQQQVKVMGRLKNNPKANAAARAAVRKLRSLESEHRMKTGKLVVGLMGVLTKEQAAKVQGLLNLNPRSIAAPSKFHFLGQLGLTAAQQAKMKPIMEQARGPMGPKAKGDPMKKAWERIVKEVLTDKNRQKLAELEKAVRMRVARSMLRGVTVTDAQWEKIDAIWKVAYQKAETNPAGRHVIYQQAQQQVAAKVLTAEQRNALQQRRRTMPTTMPAGGGRPGMKGPPKGH